MKFIETATVSGSETVRELMEEKGSWCALTPDGVMVFDHVEDRNAFLEDEKSGDKLAVVDGKAVVLTGGVCAKLHRASRERRVSFQEIVEDYVRGRANEA